MIVPWSRRLPRSGGPAHRARLPGRWKLLLVGAVLWVGGPIAHGADEPPDDPIARARVLFDNGTMLYDEGAYQEAVVAFREAYALSAEPLMLYNMASAQERMGDWEGALSSLNGYRAFAPAEERDVLERRIASLEDRIAEREAAEPEAEREPEPEPEREPTIVQTPPEPVVAERNGPGGGSLALLSLGAVGLTVGTAFTVRSLNARKQWTADCADVGGGSLCPVGARATVTRDTVSGVIADVGWIVGLGGVGGGAALALGSRF